MGADVRRSLVLMGFAMAIAAASPAVAAIDLAAGGDEPARFSRVRSTDAGFRSLIAQGHLESATFETLVDELQQSNAVVFVQFGLCKGGRFRSCVVSVTGTARERAIRIVIDTRVPLDRLIATIAHELQHAVEIVRDPAAVDDETTIALYRRLAGGMCESKTDVCETSGALDVEARVLDELHRTWASRAARR